MNADPRRAIPQTDSLLADARLAEPQRRLGRRRVRDAVHASQERVRAGSLAPEQLMDDVLRDLPARATTLTP
ncbi:MAG: L-seryl-tRNA(Sec) selenium transferase, partial [Candidatus Dormiibacterota bacterium]